jgi:regulator of RNase E activity RraA
MATTLPPELLAALAEFDSPTVSNAVELFGTRDHVEGFASLELRCLTPGLRPTVGYAVTVTADTTRPGETRPHRIGEVFDRVLAAPRPSVLVIQHVGADRARSCFVGDMFCAALRRYGGVGVVTDGGVRDLAGIRERAPGFGVFAAGAVVSHGAPAFVDFDVKASICGVTIAPGDLIHADDSGLLTVPLAIAGGVVEKARAIRAKEREFFDFLAADFAHEELKRRLVKNAH